MAPAHAPREHVRRRRRQLGWAGVAMAGALLLAGCAEAVDGTGNGANPVVSTAPTTAQPSVTAFPSASDTGLSTHSGAASGSSISSDTGAPTSIAVSSPTLPTDSISAPTSPTSSSSSGSTDATCAGADYCDGFGDKTTGWDSTSQSDYTIGYSSHGGGSYLIQSRYDGVIYSTAPIDTTSFAPDYNVRIDTDVAVDVAGAAPEVGLRCWGHNATNGGNAGFSGYLSRSTASITLRTEAGKIVPLKSETIAPGLPVDGTSVNIALSCTLSKTASGTTVADIAFAVNGKVQVATTYARTSKNYRWNTGKDAGLLLGDKGARGYFDNVAITHVAS